MDRRSAITLLVGTPALAALPPLPAFAATLQGGAPTRAAAAKILAMYKSDPAFRALVQKSPIAALRQTGIRSNSAAGRILAYELGATGAACAPNALTKASLTKGALTKSDSAFDEIAVCALTFAGHPPADFAAHAGLPPLTDAKGWRSLTSSAPTN
jgi:hypothetical protein